MTQLAQITFDPRRLYEWGRQAGLTSDPGYLSLSMFPKCFLKPSTTTLLLIYLEASNSPTTHPHRLATPPQTRFQIL